MASRRAVTVSLTEIAALFGVTTEGIRLWRKEGLPSRLESGATRFVVAECIRWRRDKDKVSAKEPAGDDGKADRLRILRAEAELKELQLAAEQHVLVRREDYDAEIERFVGGFVASVSGRLQQFERDIVQATTPGMARALTERIQDDVLRGAREYAEQLDASADADDTAEAA